MLISVVIPLFNKREQVLRAINSVLNQSYPDFELIIVDDGSTDGSADIVKSLSDPRIQLFSQVNGGVSKARNAGVKQANAEWVAFLDADDEYEPDFLNQVVNFFCTHEQDSLSMIGANYYIGSKSRTALDRSIESGIYDYFQLFGNQRSPNHSSTTVVNKKKFWEVNGFPEEGKQFEDWITWFKLAFVGSFGFISTPLGVYHHVENSVSRSKRPLSDFFSDAVLLPKTIAEYAEKYPLPAAKEKNAWDCLNEFAVNIAGMLARDGAKKLAFQMLGFIRVKYFTRKRAGRFKFLLLHLIVPQWMKRIYRSYRNK